MSKKIIYSILLFVFMFLITGCVSGTTAESNVEENTALYFTVENKYIDLKLPKDMEEYISAIVSEKEERLDVDFIYEYQGEEINVFSVCFGGENGIPVGVFSLESGLSMEVTVIIPDIEFDDEWSEEQKNEVYAVQESVNFLISEMAKEVNFIRN